MKVFPGWLKIVSLLGSCSSVIVSGSWFSPLWQTLSKSVNPKLKTMARTGRSQTVFLRWDGGKSNRKDVYFRINPQAIRFSQGAKASVVDTLGGYFLERIRSIDPQYNNLLPDLTIEGTTGIAYRLELEKMRWIWQHSSDLKSDGKPVDTYFFDMNNDRPLQEITRAGQYCYLIFISNFAYDDTVNNYGEIRFTLRCKVLRDLFFKVSAGQPYTGRLPDLNSVYRQGRLNPMDTSDLVRPDFSNFKLGESVSLPL